MLQKLSSQAAESLLGNWEFFVGRDNQIAPPGDWRIWLILAGRGFGKTRSAAQWIIHRARSGYRHFALIGETAADVRDTMVEGPAGILACSPPSFRPLYRPSRRSLVWPNGASALTFSGDRPDQLRGPQFDSAWGDEPAKWKYVQPAWDNLEMGLRMGADPRAVASTTPKPIPFLRSLLAESEGENPMVVVSHGTTFENESNLPPWFLQRLRRRYSGTRLGQQELYAQMLGDRPGALWTRDSIEALRVKQLPPLQRVAVGVDPAASDDEEAAETGIVVVGLGADNHGYVLDDRSMRGTPGEWSAAVVAAYDLHRANMVVAEKNQGGDMVTYTLRVAKPTLPVIAVHASRNKQARAEPVSALYEQGRMHHLGYLGDLEDQMTGWAPGEVSPDRLDALVWAATWLFGLDSQLPDPFLGLVASGRAKGW